MAKFFVWKQDYSVGIQKIDEQHKRMFDIINEFYTSFTENNTHAKLGETLNLLLDYAQYHFSTEEQFFVNSNYINTIEHIEEHKKFVLTINGFVNDFTQGEVAFIYRLINFLRNWLVNHILQEDQKYSEHLLEYMEKEI